MPLREWVAERRGHPPRGAPEPSYCSNAYPVWAAADINGSGAGLPALTYSSALDPRTGGTWRSRTPSRSVKCADRAYPPGPRRALRSDVVPDGRHLQEQAVSQGHDGHLSVIADVFSSTDGAAHSLDLEWENDQRFHGVSRELRRARPLPFPARRRSREHSPGEVVPLPARGGTVLIGMDGAADGNPGARPARWSTSPARALRQIHLRRRERRGVQPEPDRGRPAARLDRVPLRLRAGLHGRRRRGARAKQAADAFGLTPAPAAPHPPSPAPKPPASPRTRCKVPTRLRGETLKAAKRTLRRALPARARSRAGVPSMSAGAA